MTARSILPLLVTLGVTTTGYAQVADAGPDTSLCVNFYTMQGSQVPVGATGVWTLVMGCGTITSPNDPVSPITNMCIGSNVFVWTVDSAGIITTDMVAITVYDANMAVANAGPDTITVVAPQSYAYLSGTPVPVYPATCWWSWLQGSGLVMDPNDPNTVAVGLTIGDNILLWTCDNGPCGTTSDTVTIQMMMITGLSDDEDPATDGLWYDAETGHLRCIGPDRPQLLFVVDMHGRAAPIPTSGDVSGLAAGAYVAQAWVGERRHTLHFVLER